MTFRDDMKDREFRQAFNEDHARVAIALRLRKVREREGVTQLCVAMAAGCKQSEVARAENPDKGITLSTLVKISDGLGLIPEIRFRKQK